SVLYSRCFDRPDRHSSCCYVFLMLNPLREPTLVPYTTLFRSYGSAARADGVARQLVQRDSARVDSAGGGVRLRDAESTAASDDRSEEHTSELPSREKLVCPLLLEKTQTASMHAQ